ncbi:hypothetical protein Q7P37_004315 [Cladosporium fusiforme]
MKVSSFVLASAFTAAFGQQQWPVHDNGLNEAVQWDHYSLIVNGERLFMWSGEIHYWRLPVPELWVDVLQKVKAAGFNTFSVYGNWGWHSPKDGILDFETGAHNFSRLFDIAQDLGLYVIFRPGPYVNAEANAGGFPGWLTTGEYGTLRNNDSRYTDAWKPYMEKMSEVVLPHTVTNGGNVILYQLENEYGNQWTNVTAKTPNATGIHYMELLESNVRDSSIDIPTLHNNPNLGTKAWSTDYDTVGAGGNTDVYSVDNYPSCWSCNLAECTSVNGFPPDFTVFDYYTHFQETAPTQPSILAEFQGGSYNPWNGPAGGCVNNTGPNWVNVFYRNNLSNKVTGVNLYMVFGGTTWGGLPMPTVGTSYDYSAPISEPRTIGDKYAETKLLGFFLRAAKGLTRIEKGGNGTTNYTGNAAIFAQELYNVDGDGRFYVVKHTNTSLTSLETFKLRVSTSVGEVVIPQYASHSAIDGRQAKVLVTDFDAGGQQVIYSTAEVLAVSVLDKKPVIVFWLPAEEHGEIYLRGVKRGRVASRGAGSEVEFHEADKGLVVSFTQGLGASVLTFNNGLRVVLMDRRTAYNTWQPELSNDPHSPLDQSVLVTGPYLVRTAEWEGKTLALTGDWTAETELEVFAPRGCKKLTFNGKAVDAHKTKYGSLKGTLPAAKVTVEEITTSLPSLTEWKVSDGLPERLATYDDSGPAWVSANKTYTLNPRQPDTLPVLYADEYGFHAQNILWRGRFEANSSASTPTGVFLKVIGGTSHGWSAYLNGRFLGSAFGNVSLPETNRTLDFGNATRAGENVIFVIQDNMGHDQTTGALNPRGILNATLIGGGDTGFSSWKVAGKAGGQENIDRIRGAYNEGGLNAERLGWHLPGFDDNEWEAGSPEDGFSEPGARFYRTVFPLEIPRGYDVSMAFELAPGRERSALRAQLYVNGYMFGKFIPFLGNQVEFPVAPGILNYIGDNTVGLSIWNQDDAEASVGVGMKVLGVYESSLDTAGLDTDYLRPSWKEDRLQNA